MPAYREMKRRKAWVLTGYGLQAGATFLPKVSVSRTRPEPSAFMT
jgi:hypothetical protein